MTWVTNTSTLLRERVIYTTQHCIVNQNHIIRTRVSCKAHLHVRELLLFSVWEIMFEFFIRKLDVASRVHYCDMTQLLIYLHCH